MSSCTSLWSLLQYYFGQDLSIPCRLSLSLPPQIPSLTWILYLKFFVLTCLLELPFYTLGLWRKLSLGKILGMNLCLNLCTHPFVCLVLPKMMSQGTQAQYISAAEIFAPLVEGLILCKMLKLSIIRAQALSWTANLISWSLGAYLQEYVTL